MGGGGELLEGSSGGGMEEGDGVGANKAEMRVLEAAVVCHASQMPNN
jgi:hypothetical protein